MFKAILGAFCGCGGLVLRESGAAEQGDGGWVEVKAARPQLRDAGRQFGDEERQRSRHDALPPVCLPEPVAEEGSLPFQRGADGTHHLIPMHNGALAQVPQPVAGGNEAQSMLHTVGGGQRCGKRAVHGGAVDERGQAWRVFCPPRAQGDGAMLRIGNHRGG